MGAVHTCIDPRKRLKLGSLFGDTGTSDAFQTPYLNRFMRRELFYVEVSHVLILVMMCAFGSWESPDSESAC